MIDEWITLQGAWHAVAWKPEVLARRVIAWLTHAPFLLHDADVRFYRRFMRSLTRQVRYLRGAIGTLRDGLQLLLVEGSKLRVLALARENVGARRQKAPVERLVGQQPCEQSLRVRVEFGLGGLGHCLEPQLLRKLRIGDVGGLAQRIDRRRLVSAPPQVVRSRAYDAEDARVLRVERVERPPRVVETAP